MSLPSMASTYLRWLGVRGWTTRFAPAARCLPLSIKPRSVHVGVARDHLEQPMQFAVMRMHTDLAKVFEVGKDLFHAAHSRILSHHAD